MTDQQAADLIAAINRVADALTVTHEPREVFDVTPGGGGETSSTAAELLLDILSTQGYRNLKKRIAV